MSINPATKKNYQSIQKNEDKLILWHDLINNTVAPHHSNSWKPCSVTFDQNASKCRFSKFEILAANLPN